MADDPKVIALEARRAEGARRYSPSAARNRAAIVQAWREALPTEARVLEVGAGTGEHAAALCAAFPGLRWQPSDPDPDSRASQDAWAGEAPGRIAPALDLDVTTPDWGDAVPSPVDVVFSANMIHIAPIAACEGLFRGAGAVLPETGRGTGPGAELGLVALYGPFSRRGAMAPGNAAFTASLRARDPAWGVRDLDDQVQPLAARFGFALTRVREMPANNAFVVFERN